MTKNKAKHTPGPWRAGQYMDCVYGNPDICRTPVSPQNRTGYQTANAYGSSIEESEANARLIASAPDLLEAAKGVLVARTESEENAAYHNIRAAIAKAEGKTNG